MSMAWDVSSNIWASKEASQASSVKGMDKNGGKATKTTTQSSTQDSANQTTSKSNTFSVSDTFCKSIWGTDNNQQ